MSETKHSPSLAAAFRREVFVQEYVIDFDATRAATVAGYKPTRARVTGSKLLREPAVRRAVDERLAARGATRELDAAQVLADLRRLVDGCMTPVPVKDDDGRVVGWKPVNASGAARGLELIGKHLAMFTERHEVEQEQEVTLVLHRPGVMQPWTTGEGSDEDEDAEEGSVAAAWRLEAAVPRPCLVDSGTPKPEPEPEAAVETETKAATRRSYSGVVVG